jgi:hypothetical protein
LQIPGIVIFATLKILNLDDFGNKEWGGLDPQRKPLNLVGGLSPFYRRLNSQVFYTGEIEM